MNPESAMSPPEDAWPVSGVQAWADFLEHLASARTCAHRWAVAAHRRAGDVAAASSPRIDAEIEDCLARAERVLRAAIDRALLGPRDESNGWKVYTDTMRYVAVLLHDTESTRPHS